MSSSSNAGRSQNRISSQKPWFAASDARLFTAGLVLGIGGGFVFGLVAGALM